MKNWLSIEKVPRKLNENNRKSIERIEKDVKRTYNETGPNNQRTHV